MDKEIKKVEKQAEKAVEEAAKELNVKLPSGAAPTPTKIIAYATLIGGLSIVGGTFIDVVSPNKTNITLYLVRILVGLLAIGTAYGLIEKRRWAIWSFASIALIGILVNPILSIIPTIITTYLFTKRNEFKPSILDIMASKLILKTEKIIYSLSKK